MEDGLVTVVVSGNLWKCIKGHIIVINPQKLNVVASALVAEDGEFF